MAEDRLKVLIELARQGNRKQALDLLPKWVEPSERRTAHQALQAEPTLRRAVFVPLVDQNCAAKSLACAVRVGPGEWSPRWREESRAAALAAIEKARELTGARAPAECLVAKLELADALGHEIDEVSGRSLYLGTLLAAAAYFGDKRPLRNVLATGAFDEQIHFLHEKLELFETVHGELGCDAMLVAAAVAPNESQLAGCVYCGDAEVALERVFGFVPWSADAERTAIFVSCGESRPPRRFEGCHVQPIELPSRIGAGDAAEAARKIRTMLQPGERYELAIDGPVALAAALADAVANHPAWVRFIDAISGRPAWDNRSKRAYSLPPVKEQSVARVVVSTGGEVLADGWSPHAVPRHIEIEALPVIVEEFLAEYAGAAELHLAVRGPQMLAFAIVSVLANTRRVSFYSWSDGALDLWLEL